jgi:hypothetical protein
MRDRHDRPTGASGHPSEQLQPAPGIDLHWLPLGAGGQFVRLAYRERRPRLDLYHSALEVYVPEGRFVIETAWPIPDADAASRGVALEGPVFARRIARFRAFRYEVRRWRDGEIPDIRWAVASPERVSDDESAARLVLELAGSLPELVWGRDELGTGDMWNSNSVVSWLLARGGLPAAEIRPPEHGRAPGWRAGIVAAQRWP